VGPELSLCDGLGWVGSGWVEEIGPVDNSGPAERHTPTTLYRKQDTIRYDTRRYFNVRTKANMSQLNLPHGNDN